MKKKIYILSSAVLTVFGLFFTEILPVSAAIYYPISDLDGCRNGRECYLFCEIPANFPACRFYGKNILNAKVLGQKTAKISYPIAELGNCADAKTCREYCESDNNQEACIAYGRKSGLSKTDRKPVTSDILIKAKKELACNDFNSCQKLCVQADNIDKCLKFAKKYKLSEEKADKETTGNLTSSIMKQAVKNLGCKDTATCRTFCEQKENMEKCLEFGKRYGIIKKDLDDKEARKKEEMLKMFQTELGCNNWDACRLVCEKPENQSTCQSLYENYRKKSEETDTGDMPSPTLEAKPTGLISPTPVISTETPTPTPTAGQ